ncbi:Mannose permease IID component [Clostridium sp. C105KSO15]|nr:Mannose permease IID component [Clostridium sp. C105KSO15]
MAHLDNAYTENSLVTKSDMRKTFWRSFPLQGCFNYERMQNVGFCYSMIPVLKRLYPEKEEAREALKRHLSFFNTTPQVVSFITGACVALEEENKKSKEGFDIESITALKAALMGPIAGIGDSFFWGTFRIIAAGVGCGLASKGSLLGAVLFLLIFNIPHYLVRYYGLKLGYKSGITFIETAQSSGMIQILTNCAKIIGLCVVGAMIASMVAFSTPLVLTMGETSVEIQGVFDQILPKVLPLLLTFGIYGLLKKGYKTVTVMLGIIIAGIACAFFGIL